MVSRILFALALLSGALPATAATTEQRTAFGSLVLIEETRVRDPGEPPIMHVATEWTRLRLRWQSADGTFGVELTDNGGMLSIDIKGHDCVTGGDYRRYERRTGEQALWRELVALTKVTTSKCPRITPDQARQYVAGLAAAHQDFARGVEAMKRRALVLYRGPLLRCRWNRNSADPFNPCDGVW